MTLTPPAQEPNSDYVDWGSGELLAMAALDAYPIDDGLPKSTSVVFRIHQLGRELQAERLARQQAERTIASIATMLGWMNVPPQDTLESDIRALKARVKSEAEGRQQAERERDKILFLIEAMWEAAKGNEVSDFALSHVPVQWIADNRKELAASEQARAQAEQTIRIMELATPLEDDLSPRIDDMCKHLLQEQGYTLNGIGRLLIDCQKRMAADWLEVGAARRSVESAEQARARLQSAYAASAVSREHWKARAESAEQALEALVVEVGAAEHWLRHTETFAAASAALKAKPTS